MTSKSNSPTTLPPLVVIHSAIADGGLWIEKNDKGQVVWHDATKLWYYMRALDVDGSGAAVVDLATAASTLDRSIKTIRRWIDQGLKLGLLREKVKVGVGKFRIFYSSLVNVCLSQGITDMGAVARVEVERLKEIKFAATEAEAKRLQAQSEYQARRKNRHRKVLKASKLLNASPSARGVILFRGRRYTFLRPGAIAVGGSQKRIAWELSRHPSTVQRRLDRGYREKHNVEPVRKTQLAIAKPEYAGELFKTSETLEGRSSYFRPSWSKTLVYKPYTNIYDLDIDVYSAKYQRYNLRRAWKKMISSTNGQNSAAGGRTAHLKNLSPVEKENDPKEGE